MKTTIRLRLNGKPATLDTDDERTLLWVLRTDLGLTGTKYGCGVGLCGSCTVRRRRQGRPLLPDLARRTSQGKEVTTIEGLAHDGELHPLQQAFVDHGGFQCGYCTPGMIMNAYGLLLAGPASVAREDRRGAWRTTSAAAAPTRGSWRRSSRSSRTDGRPAMSARRPGPPLLPQARRRRHRRARPPRAADALARPGPRAIPRTSTPTSGSARTAASPSSPARSRWARAS